MALDPKRRFYLDGYGRNPNDYTWHYQMLNRLGSINTSIQNSGGTELSKDAFDRLRISTPYTLFDSQNRYKMDDQFSNAVLGGSVTYNSNESVVNIVSGDRSGDYTIRQTNRRFPYQPGKSLLILMSFQISANSVAFNDIVKARVGYFDEDNGIYFEQMISNEFGTPATYYWFKLRSAANPTVSVTQTNWNVDKFDGTGPSGRTLDSDKAQIMFINLEWLGVGIVKVGFFVDGIPYVAHEFRHDNQVTSTYMQTATLPIRFEAEGGAIAGTSTIKQICSTVISEGGYSAYSEDYVAKQDVEVSNITPAAYLPIVSVRLATNREGAVVLPNKYEFLPLTNQNYEVVLLRNPTLTGATFANTIDNNDNIEYDVAATAISDPGEIVDIAYMTATGSGGIQGSVTQIPYKWDLQLGTSLGVEGDTNDILTLAVRTVSGATQGSGVGFITLYDLTI